MDGRCCSLQIKQNATLKHGLENGYKRLKRYFEKMRSPYKMLMPLVVSLEKNISEKLE